MGFRGRDGGGGGGFNRGPRELFDAVCADCKQACQVPFQPTPGRDVRCRDCFAKSKGTQ